MLSQTNVIGRNIKVQGASIAGVVCCLPEKTINNEHFINQFGEEAVKDVIKMIGVETRYWTNEHTTSKDLCLKAGEHLLKRLDWTPQSVDAIIFVSQTPDFKLPASACALQADLKLPTTCIAFDINLGCSGYPYALWLGMTIVQSGAARRVLLAVGDTVSKIVDPSDRSTALLFGDAGSVTAIESDANQTANFVLGTDGSGVNNLIIPHGGYKKHPLNHDEDKVFRSPECLYMNGGEIFNFTLKSVPALINETIALSGFSIDEHDAFLLHQANLFMLKHLAKKSKLPLEKTPINIEQYGNTSCASIPLLMATRLQEALAMKCMRLGMFGFGVGYSWAGASLSVGPLKCLETVTL